MRKKILTINELYSDNLGDQAIAEAMRKYCQVEPCVQVDSVDYSFRKLPSQLKHNASNKNRFLTIKAYLPNILKKMFFLVKNFRSAKRIASGNYDLALIGGGQLLLGKGSFPYSLFLYTYFLSVQGTKIKLVSVGVGENFSLVEKFMVKKSLERIESIYLRDRGSAINLLNIFSRESSFSPDIAYYLHEEIGDAFIYKKRRSLVCPVEYGVYMRYRHETGNPVLNFEQYKYLWCSLIRDKINAGYHVLIAATTNKDFDFSEKLLKGLDFHELKMVTVHRCTTHTDFSLIAKEAVEVQSGRMHALILCHNLGLDIVPFNISQKINSFEKEYLSNKALVYKDVLERLRKEILQ